jgi:hypothetical protein
MTSLRLHQYEAEKRRKAFVAQPIRHRQQAGREVVERVMTDVQYEADDDKIDGRLQRPRLE